MIVITYDSTFEGFLTVVFECYQYKLEPCAIVPGENFQEQLFAEVMHVVTDAKKAERVWQGLKKKLSALSIQLPFRVFLSGIPEAGISLYNYIRRVFDTNFNIETDYGDSNILNLKKLNRKVNFEAMRMVQFVRFQKTKDGVYFAPIEPEYNVIPLIIKHFKARFADQQWLIYDIKRDYGIYYNLEEVEEITIEAKQFDRINGKVDATILQEQEEEYRALWKNYFDHINIKERKNLKVQRQHMPKRYWKFLPEVQDNH